MPREATLSDFGFSFEQLIQEANRAQEATSRFGAELSQVSNETRKNAQAISAVVDALSTNMAGLGKEAANIVAALNGISSALKQDRQTVEHHTTTIDEMWEAYKKMGVEVDKLNLDLKTLSFTEKEMSKVVQLGTAYNKNRSDSYTALSEKYRAIKILIDNMTVAERENTEEGRNFVAMAREMYEQMNLLQQRTGKYQLQVGDYSKAMTGLNIATNQVVRELPVLANGVSMFAIAISNNIPILMDNILQVKRANAAQESLKKELLETAAAYEAAGKAAEAASARESAAGIKTTSVTAALAKAVFSWQTALVLVLTVLPNIIRNLEKKKKAMEENNAETNYAISLAKIYRDSLTGEANAIDKVSGRLSILLGIYQDETRSAEDRKAAMNAIHRLFGDQIQDYGDAATSVQKYIEKLDDQAVAEEKLQRILDLKRQNREQSDKLEELYATKEYKRAIAAEAEAKAAVEEQRAYVEQQKILKISPGKIQSAEAILSERERAFEKASNKVQNIIGKETTLIQNNNDEITRLTQDLTKQYLDALGEIGGAGDKEPAAARIPDYYMQVLDATVGLMEEGVEKELAILEVGWLKEQKGLNDNLKALTDMREGANKEELEEINNQIDNIVKLMTLGEEKYRQERMRVVKESLHEYEEVVEEEIDLDEQRRRSVERELKEEMFVRNQAYYTEYELSQRTADDKEELNRRLLASEYEYWDKYLTKLREMGILLPHEYEKIMSELAKGQEKGRRRRNRFGGVVEAGMAMFSDWGRTDESTGQRVLKDEYKDFVSAVDNALKQSMSYMDEWMDKRLEMAEVAVEAAEKEMEAAKSALDYELEARNQGYANSVETARRELEIQKANHRKALEEKKKVEEEQRMIDVATQISSLVTATANIWSSMTKNTGIAGPILAAAATALMWGSFTAAQVKAAQVARSKQYGEGTVELLEGGSHASGHDIDMGVAKDGTRRRAEGGEFFAIINRRNSRKYRKIIPDVINSFNDGTFGEKYYNANAAMGEFALGLLAGGSPTDVSKLEKEVHAIREQGEVNRYTDSRGNVIVRYKNLTRKYKI